MWHIHWFAQGYFLFTNIFLKNYNTYLYNRTVDRLWSITEDLNILYKDNWTRLAAQEVKEFQVINKPLIAVPEKKIKNL